MLGCKGQAGKRDVSFEDIESVPDCVALVGALTLREYVDTLGTNGLISVARRVFCAMRAEEARHLALTPERAPEQQ
jgi:hypothetical protein